MGFFFFFWPWDMWDVSSLTRNWTHTACIGRWSLNHWTAREVLIHTFKRFSSNWSKLIFVFNGISSHFLQLKCWASIQMVMSKWGVTFDHFHTDLLLFLYSNPFIVFCGVLFVCFNHQQEQLLIFFKNFCCKTLLKHSSLLGPISTLLHMPSLFSKTPLGLSLKDALLIWHSPA